MLHRNFRMILFLSLGVSAIIPGMSQMSFAHCDGLDGPVVRAAQKALETGNVDYALIWVQKRDEPQIQKAFQKTLKIRKVSLEARELADTYFFETLVRIHRAGEKAPYEGLKAAGRDLGPAIPAADRALQEGAAEALLKLLTEAVHGGIQARFKQAVARKKFPPQDVDAGREYVNAYVEFIHYVERLYETATDSAQGHSEKPAGSEAHP
jgi:uncharacterized protein DUF6448